jgi:hypothetical protein
MRPSSVLVGPNEPVPSGYLMPQRDNFSMPSAGQYLQHDRPAPKPRGRGRGRGRGKPRAVTGRSILNASIAQFMRETHLF